MLINANKTKFLLQTFFSKITAWGYAMKNMSLHHEKHMQLEYLPTSANIVSSEAHAMSCFHTRNF